MIHLIFIIFKSLIKTLCPVNGGAVILEDTTPIRTEMLTFLSY